MIHQQIRKLIKMMIQSKLFPEIIHNQIYNQFIKIQIQFNQRIQKVWMPANYRGHTISINKISQETKEIYSKIKKMMTLLN